MEYNSAVFLFQANVSGRKHRCSGGIDGTTTLLLNLCLVAQLCPSNIRTVVHQAALAMGILQTRILKWVSMPCSGTVCFIVCVSFLCIICVKSIIKLLNDHIKLIHNQLS